MLIVVALFVCLRDLLDDLAVMSSVVEVSASLLAVVLAMMVVFVSLGDYSEDLSVVMALVATFAAFGDHSDDLSC